VEIYDHNTRIDVLKVGAGALRPISGITLLGLLLIILVNLLLLGLFIVA
jgi:hypothetical protein